MKIEVINLSELVNDKLDSISGRGFGEGYAEKKHVLDVINRGGKWKIIIDSDRIKAINDSFWKGFFSSTFEKLKKKDTVKSFFEFEASQYYKESIEKNLTILDSIYNS